MMRMRAGLLVLTLCMGVTGCYYDVEETLYGEQGCDPTPATFGGVIEPLVASNCAEPGCHSGPSPAAGIAFGEHADVAAMAPLMLERMNRNPGDAGLMPPNRKLDTCDIAAFDQWLADGAPNN